MEESDSGQQRKRCPCGFWGSPQTSGLCSKCYKATVQEETQDLDPKAEMMRNTERQSQYTSHDSLTPGPSSFLSTSRAAATTIEKAEEFIRQAVKNSNNVDKTESSSTNNTAKNTVSASEPDSAKPANASSSTACSVPATTSNNDSSASTNNVSASTNIANGETIIAIGDKVINSGAENEVSKDSNAVASISSDSLPNTPEKRGIKRDSSALEDSAPDSSPEKGGTKSKKKCAMCKCKLELAQRAIGRCRCDNVYCSLHRLPEQHRCPFDHKEDGRREAREKMVKPTRHLGTCFKRLGSDS